MVGPIRSRASSSSAPLERLHFHRLRGNCYVDCCVELRRRRARARVRRLARGSRGAPARVRRHRSIAACDRHRAAVDRPRVRDPAQRRARDACGRRDGRRHAARDGRDDAIDGNVNGDLLAFGQQVTVRGNVTGNLVTGGQTITSKARSAATSSAAPRLVAAANARVGRDFYGFGHDVERRRRAEVAGNAIAFGETVDVDGRVGIDFKGFGAQRHGERRRRRRRRGLRRQDHAAAVGAHRRQRHGATSTAPTTSSSRPVPSSAAPSTSSSSTASSAATAI